MFASENHCKKQKKMTYVLITGSTTTNGHHCGIVNAFSIEPSHPSLVQDPIGVRLNQTNQPHAMAG